MANFKFYQDQKHTIWLRTFFSVSASTLMEAQAAAALLVNEGVHNNITENCPIFVHESINLYDTIETISVGANEGRPTIEIFSESGEHISNNGCGIEQIALKSVNPDK